MRPTLTEGIGTLLFGLAVLHTFLVHQIRRFSDRFPRDSTSHALLHLASEVEIIFGAWATVFFLILGFTLGFSEVVQYQDKLGFTEPLFVFCILVMASARPVLHAAQIIMEHAGFWLAGLTRLPRKQVDLFVLLFLGPLSGSLITEPGAMTLTALLLLRTLRSHDRKMLHLLLATLFVNVSIGGALTSFAAPPILMVAGSWNWDLSMVFQLFGLRALCGVFLNALLFVALFWREIPLRFASLGETAGPTAHSIPFWVAGAHVMLLVLLVLNAHHASLAVGVLMLFLGLSTVTQKYQDRLRLRESLLVSFFLGGIIVFGPVQSWWLGPLLKNLTSFSLLIGATALTAITDNAALTFLGSQVTGLSDLSKYSLVAGAIAGGGLTIIANAPNAAGFSILQEKFPGGVHPGRLFVAALLPTLVAFVLFAL